MPLTLTEAQRAELEAAAAAETAGAALEALSRRPAAGRGDDGGRGRAHAALQRGQRLRLDGGVAAGGRGGAARKATTAAGRSSWMRPARRC